MKTLITGIAAGVALTLLTGLGVGLSGAFNVAATVDDAPLLKWFLHESFEASVARRSDGIQAPNDLGSSARIERGARSFAAMCAGCHTPPGMTDTPRTQGLNPRPPALAELIGHASSAQTFWVIKNGARMTGMPAFGPTHDDEALWDLTAFIQAAGQLEPEQYQSLSAGPVDDGHDHRHGEEADHEGGEPHDGNHSHTGAKPHPRQIAGNDPQKSPAKRVLSAPPAAGAAPEASVDYFHAALRSGDESAVVSVLSPDVRIFESGRVEGSLAEYRSHHLQSDLKAAQHIQHEVIERTVRKSRDEAWVMTRTRVHGEFGGQSINRPGTETMNLVRTAQGWRIAHIHWSFGAEQKPAPKGHEGHQHEH